MKLVELTTDHYHQFLKMALEYEKTGDNRYMNFIPEKKYCKFLEKLDKKRYILLTIYQGDTGKFDADIGAGGLVNKGELPIDGLNRELKEETGKKDWKQTVLLENVFVKKKNQICHIFQTNCDLVPEAVEASTDGE